MKIVRMVANGVVHSIGTSVSDRGHGKQARIEIENASLSSRLKMRQIKAAVIDLDKDELAEFIASLQELKSKL